MLAQNGADLQLAGLNPDTLKPQLSPESRKGRVLLVDMPFRTVRFGSLGLSTIKSILNTNGLAADVSYFSVKFARQMGTRFYNYISHLGAVRHSGEIFFTASYYDFSVDSFLKESLRPYFQTAWKKYHAAEMLGPGWTEESFLAACENVCQQIVPATINEFMENTDWEKYDIVGFSLIFDQTMPSIALARQIKQRFPEKTIIFGGPSCDGEMGLELLRVFPWIDIVAIGEADLTVLPLLQAIRERKPLEDVPGIGFRRDGKVIQTAPTPLLQEMDRLPEPDYEEFFAAIDGSDITPQMYFESSRGCWWGQKHLCSFCGLNANGLSFRRKSAERTIREIIHLTDKYRCKSIGATDNILDISFFKTVFPALKMWRETQPPETQIELFYEMKSNVRKEQLQIAREAGLALAQPGIESFNDHVLQLMDKGATGIQQMQFIKWSAELGINLLYGVLYKNPGETMEDYEDIIEKLSFIMHLPPPTYISDISLDRFSPYFKDPSRFGISNVRPHETYFQVFREKDMDFSRMAYRFEFDHVDSGSEQLERTIQRCIGGLMKWKAIYRPNTLVYDVSPDRVWILDRRSGQPSLVSLTGMQAEIFLYCDEHRALTNVQDKFVSFGREIVAAWIDKLQARRWLYKDSKNRCLALPVRSDLSEYITRRLEAKARSEPAAHVHG